MLHSIICFTQLPGNLYFPQSSKRHVDVIEPRSRGTSHSEPCATPGGMAWIVVSHEIAMVACLGSNKEKQTHWHLWHPRISYKATLRFDRWILTNFLDILRGHILPITAVSQQIGSKSLHTQPSLYPVHFLYQQWDLRIRCKMSWSHWRVSCRGFGIFVGIFIRQSCLCAEFVSCLLTLCVLFCVLLQRVLSSVLVVNFQLQLTWT